MARELEGTSDRSVVVMMGSHVEDALEDALLLKMPDLKVGGEAYNELFVGDAPLASFSSKIKIGRALGIIDSRTEQQLHVLREIRNACAHCRKAISFARQELLDALNVLSSSEAELIPVVKKTISHERFLFIGMCIILSTMIEGHARPTTRDELFLFLPVGDP